MGKLIFKSQINNCSKNNFLMDKLLSIFNEKSYKISQQAHFLIIIASHFLKMWQYMPYANTNQQMQDIICVIFGTR